jgi:hypothetical protein
MENLYHMKCFFKRGIVSAVATVSLFMFCSKEYNPFSDYSNAAVFLTHQSIRNNDTIDVFCTETLLAVVLVKELVDSFSVHCAGNRLWPDMDSVLYKKNFASEPFAFCFSFHDTGKKTISLSTYASSGAIDTSVVSLFVKSPLFQADIQGRFGDSLKLLSLPVKDRDINYLWSFGAGTRYSSRVCSTTVVAYPAIIAGKGWLWVSDGVFSSCADTFNFLFRDTAAPNMLCVNENYVGKDTVYTGDSVFNFKVRITNRGDQWVDSASIDSRPFYRKDNKVYYSLIDKMYTHDQKRPLEVAVFALSHFQNGVPASKLFTLIFSPDLAPAVPAEIRLLAPSADSTLTLIRRYPVSGTVENHAFGPFNGILIAYVNDSLLPETKPIACDRSAAWDWPLELSDGPTRITLQLKDAATLSTLNQVSFVLLFADSAHDSVPPRILAVTANGAPADNFFTDKALVKIGVQAFDEISGIDSVFINNRLCRTPDQGNWYYDSLTIRHTHTGNEALIRAKDRKNNDTVTSVVLYRNRMPVIQRFPASSFVAIDSLYTDTLDAFDPDGDTIIYEKTVGPQDLSIGPDGVVAWRPTQLDTGSHTVSVRLWDGYQPMFRSYTLYVYGAGHPGPVKFAIKAEDFPTALVAGRDTLRMALAIAPTTGVRPLLFSGRITNKTRMVLPEGPDSVLTWAPLPQDTGYAQLVISVKDAFPSSDTLYPRILVVQPNRPCSLIVRFKGDMTPGGVLDLNKKRGKDTLTFTIKDPDNPLVERHDVSILETRTQTSSIIDSAVVDTFSLVLDPQAMNGYDTIIGIVRDRANTRDTVKQKVYFGMPPYSPQAVYPVNLTSITGESVSLSWQDVDPDGDSLTFDVYFGATPEQMSRVAVTREASFIATGLLTQRAYYWRIVAHDWKSFTESPLWQFTTR